MPARIKLSASEEAAVRTWAGIGKPKRQPSIPKSHNKSKSQPESKIVKSILQYLHTVGVFAWRNNTTGVYDPTRKIFRKKVVKRGVSDILGLHGGKFLAIEVKTKTGKLSPEQEQFIDDVNKRGGLAFVARSIDDVALALAKEFEP